MVAADQDVKCLSLVFGVPLKLAPLDATTTISSPKTATVENALYSLSSLRCRDESSSDGETWNSRYLRKQLGDGAERKNLLWNIS